MTVVKIEWAQGSRKSLLWLKWVLKVTMADQRLQDVCNISILPFTLSKTFIRNTYLQYMWPIPTFVDGSNWPFATPSPPWKLLLCLSGFSHTAHVQFALIMLVENSWSFLKRQTIRLLISSRQTNGFSQLKWQLLLRDFMSCSSLGYQTNPLCL